MLLGLMFGLISTIAVIRPMPSLFLPTRRRALCVIIASIIIFSCGLFLTPQAREGFKQGFEESMRESATRTDRKHIANEVKVAGTSYSPGVVRLFQLNEDEFIRRYNLALKAYDRPGEVYKLPRPPSRDIVNLRVAVNGRTSPHLTINLFLDQLTKKIRKVEGVFSGDGTERSGVDVFFRLIATILAIEDVTLSPNKDKMYPGEHERVISQSGLIDPGALEIDGAIINRTLKVGVYELTPPSIKDGMPTMLEVYPR